MSQAVATIEPRAEQHPPKLPTMTAGGAVRAIVPQDFEGAWRIASAVCKAQMAPRGLDTPEKAMVAIMHGLEVGLTPMNALQSIAVVNGRPTIWGDGAIGLARASGLLEWMEEKYEGAEYEDGFKAICIVKRKGEPKPTRSEFSVADAKKAGLWGKQGPWQQYPKRMLQMRARAFALRDGFADVLKGLSIKEEVEDYAIRDAMPRDEPPAPPVPEIASPSAQPAATAEDLVFVQGESEPLEEMPGAQTAENDDGPPAPTVQTSVLAALLGDIKNLTGNIAAADWATANKARIAALTPDERKTFDLQFLKRQGEFSRAFAAE